MRRALIGSVTALLFSAALGAQASTQQPPPPPPTAPPAQQQTTPAAPEQKAAELTLVGCVVQGTSAGVFIFENAVDPAKKDDKPRTLKLVSSGEEMDFTTHLNHKVQLVGTLTPRTPPTPAPPAGQKIDEKDLQVFTVKTVTPVATTCSAAGQ